MKKNDKITDSKQIEQLRVQLAGCGVAALGYCRKGKQSDCKKESYGWSQSLADVQDLYEKYIKAEKDRKQAITEFKHALIKRACKIRKDIGCNCGIEIDAVTISDINEIAEELSKQSR